MQCSICNNILCAGEQGGVGEGENGVKPLLSDFDLVIVMYTFVLYLKYKLIRIYPFICC